MDEPTTPVQPADPMRVTTDALGSEPSLLLRAQRREQRLLLLLLPLFAVACLAGWLASELPGAARWYERLVLVPSAAGFVGLMAWLWRCPPAHVARVRAATLVLGPGIVLVGQGQLLADLARNGFDDRYYFGWSPWIILCSALFIFLLPSRYSWRFAVGYYLVSLCMLVVFLALNNRPLMQFIQVEFLLNGVVAPPVFIALLSAFTRMRSDYTRARAQAESLRELALLDALTGLPNRRAFGQSFARARARQARTKAPLCVLLLDIDHFKRVNDTHGHAAGDDVLRGLAGVLKRELRGTDEVFRWGGEEFAALLEETPATVLNVVAERVRAAVAGAPLLSHWPVTVSIGATHVAPGENEDTVFARADTALYRSKREGRNRVTVVETALAD